MQPQCWLVQHKTLDGCVWKGTHFLTEDDHTVVKSAARELITPVPTRLFPFSTCLVVTRVLRVAHLGGECIAAGSQCSYVGKTIHWVGGSGRMLLGPIWFCSWNVAESEGGVYGCQWVLVLQ